VTCAVLRHLASNAVALALEPTVVRQLGVAGPVASKSQMTFVIDAGELAMNIGEAYHTAKYSAGRRRMTESRPQKLKRQLRRLEMICSKCGGLVRWRGPFSNLTHTECDNCGARNCQIVEWCDDQEFADAEDDYGCGEDTCVCPDQSE
jgi:hypothetical protein